MEHIYNDFTINIATANGTGSQSSNLILLNSMFQMGVPVSGKNLFPSNIAGLPTWFIIRASDDGYQAPGNKAHIQVLMNKDSWRKDLEKLENSTKNCRKNQDNNSSLSSDHWNCFYSIR